MQNPEQGNASWKQFEPTSLHTFPQVLSEELEGFQLAAQLLPEGLTVGHSAPGGADAGTARQVGAIKLVEEGQEAGLVQHGTPPMTCRSLAISGLLVQ